MDTSNPFMRMAMRSAMMRNAGNSYGQPLGPGGLVGQIINGVNDAHDEQDMRSLLGNVSQQLQDQMGQGASLQQALGRVIAKNPELLFQLPSEHFTNAATLLNAIAPKGRQFIAAPPGSAIIDQGTGQTVNTVPGRDPNLPPEVQLALFAAGVDPNNPTDDQLGRARSLAAAKFDRPPSEIDQLFNAAGLTGDARKQTAQSILAKRGNNNGEPSLMGKLMQERDSAAGNGNAKDAQSYQDMINAMPKLGFLDELGRMGGPTPGASPAASGAPQPQASTITPDVLRNLATQAVTTGKPVSYRDNQGAPRILTPQVGQQYLNSLAPQPAPGTPGPVPSPAPAPMAPQ